MKSLIIVLVMILFFASCSKKEKSESSVVSAKDSKVSEVFKIVPANTDIVLKISNLEDLFKSLDIKPGEQNNGIDELNNQLGLSINSLDDLKNNGVDVKRDFVFMAKDFDKIDNEILFKMAILVPSTDNEKLKNMIIDAIRSERSDMQIEENEGCTVVNINDADSPKIFICEKDNYLALAFGTSRNVDGKSLALEIKNGNSSIMNDEEFASITKTVASGEQFFTYLTFKNINNKNFDFSNVDSGFNSFQDLSMTIKSLKEYKSLAFNLNFTSEDIHGISSIELVEGSNTAKMMKNVKFDSSALRGIELNPLLLVQFVVNPEFYYQNLMSTLAGDAKNSVEESIKQFENEFGINLKADLVDNLSGSFNFGMFEGSSINMMNYNLASTFGIKNKSLAMETIDKLIETLDPSTKALITKENVDGIETYVYTVGFSQIYIGVTNDRIVIAPNKMFYKNAIRSGGKGYLDKVDSSLEPVLSGDNQLVYLNFNELLDALKNFSAFVPTDANGKSYFSEENMTELKKLKYIIASSTIEGNNFNTIYKVETDFKKPFFVGMKDVFKMLTSE
ncbi:MAG: DUF3352 domain-containing protein [Candidatus Delongbacteria bacterium]|nr:DUF3352 domain-containing protein [Candidatus Delongbacteria bacterium]MBN2836518.1 DUF3352 domain-containing protein [Candidatus Delongbacteria bacterium]